MSEIDSLRPLAAVLLPALGILTIVASHRRPDIREGFTILTALATFGVVASLVPAALSGTVHVSRLGTFVPGVDLTLHADPLGMIFALLASTLWLVTSFYSIGYMRGLDEHSQTRYFAAFAGSVGAAIGVAFASNLVALYVFYELLTVATYPLVAHDESDEARAAGRKYLTYTFGGGVAVLAGTILVFWTTGTVAFTPGGIADLAAADPVVARAAFALLAGGFGVKAALIPVHSWLPDAMVAPTPVSGLLHAVAVVKSGVFGIARVVLDVFGPETVQQLGVGLPLAAVAAVTIVVSSVIALRQDNLKRRLAYSTISQLSYIVLGLGLLSPAALVGGLLHIPAHAFMKLTLFFCAGAIHVETHTDDISDMAGIGKRMPLTMAAFGVASLGMAGLPLLAGFVSKWYLLIGSIDGGNAIFALVLLTSGLLNIGYFWPIVYQAFFQTPEDSDAKPLVEFPIGGTRLRADGGERPSDADETADDPDVASEGRPDESVEEGIDPEAFVDTAEESDTGVPVDTAGRVEPDIEPSEEESQVEIEARIEGEYAVDRHPSDHLGADSTDDEADRDAREGDDVDEDLAGETHDDHDHHHGGPPAAGWERRGFGEESTWFMLGPITAAAAGAVALGIAPRGMVFLALIERVLFEVTGVVL
ncbi:proton-conducting transporter transmembrane domain-containing protein [Halobellus limi]|uniref:Monovalent cation/H+ antiporter subunit D family protein n=1 Tax=Halobellus limi TaxID=699433 RepID=A0A1H5YPN2_9EURY|nr:proton-conducting transporter membrane subunit [Halobellus limi]QCC48377.1 monovalent cation/H+ antiporter subunit D family protein [Halobellus limi]SEG26069.1 multicomponent Na+:H+ antiporter subunit D [Halobellus limi]